MGSRLASVRDYLSLPSDTIITPLERFISDDTLKIDNSLVVLKRTGLMLYVKLDTSQG